VKALRWHARGDVRLDDVDEPDAGPGEITVEVAAAGICGSDITSTGPGRSPSRSTPTTR
jgi:(R,R)-butanediol dehydrogenase/meso-butanediol dehydrogenase/diacetyl reductase